MAGGKTSLESMVINNFSGRKILVTGATGFVGSHLVQELQKRGGNVIATYQSINKNSYFYTENLDNTAILAQIDISDYDSVKNVIAKYNPEFVFHLAAQPLVDVAYRNPLTTCITNIVGTLNILEAARIYGDPEAIIVASSDKAYGKTKKRKYKEGDPLVGDHPYEVSKSAADLICQMYVKTYGLPVVVSRFGNIYGEGDLNFDRIIPGIMQSINNRTTLPLRSNGRYVRDYLYVKDVVYGYLLMASKIKSVKGQVFNFGSKETLDVKTVISRSEKILQRKIPYKILNIAKNEIPFQSLDFTKAKRMLQWKPRYDFEKTLGQIFSWYENYFKTQTYE